MVNQKTVGSLRRSVELIGADTFDEDAIRLLLISARDLCGTLPIFREIADFVAHPNRGKGLFFDRIYSRYCKLRLLNERIDRLDLNAYESGTPWDRINDDILKVVSLETISKHDFTYFFQLSLLDCPSELLNRFFGLSLVQASALIAGSYKINGGKYVLRSSSDTPQLKSLMRFLQGMVQFRQVFSESDLRPELSELSSYIQDAIQFPLQLRESIEGRFDGLLLCIICMLQDARFIFDGQEVGRLFLSREERSELNFLQLCCEFDALKRKVRFPVILTNLNADVYLAFDGSKYRFFEPLPLMNAVRDGDGRLMLKEARI